MFLVSNYELNNKHSLKGKLIMVKFLQQLLNLSHLIIYQVNYDFAKLYQFALQKAATQLP